MTTIYIKGKDILKGDRIKHYHESVRKGLNKSNLVQGDHYIQGVSGSKEYILYWITSRISLKEFKKSIGSKVVWNHRLTFYEDIQEVIPKVTNKLSAEQTALVERFAKQKLWEEYKTY